uniref:Transthyretin-like family protein n=1 Tax=Parastrongyloides trichosuri TaxID=131310 RepID=A0A0N5A2R0_PARTI
MPRDQAIGAMGNVLCLGKPVKNITVRLYRYDKASEYDLLHETTTDSEGNFVVEGYDTGRKIIKPYIFIYHTCGITSPHEKNCEFKTILPISRNYINFGESVRFYEPFWDIELSGSYRKVEIRVKVCE